MISHAQTIEDLKLPLNMPGSSLTFPRLIEDFCLNSEKMIREEIKNFLEKMDHEFRYSKGRIENYYVNNTRQRTITTLYGDITYERTIYKDRLSNKSYIYVGIPDIPMMSLPMPQKPTPMKTP